MDWIKIKEDNSNLPAFGEVVLLLSKREDKSVVDTGTLDCINKSGVVWKRNSLDDMFSIFGGNRISAIFIPTHYCRISIPDMECSAALKLVKLLRLKAHDSDLGDKVVIIPDGCGKHGFLQGNYKLSNILHFLADMLEE